MAHAINDLLVSEMTLLWPSKESCDENSSLDKCGDSNILPYSWENGIMENIPQSSGKTKNGLYGGSFVNLFNVLDQEAFKSYENSCSHGENINTCDSCFAQAQSIHGLNRVDQWDQTTRGENEIKEKTENWYDYSKSISETSLVESDDVEDFLSSDGSGYEACGESLIRLGELEVKDTFIHPAIVTGFRYVVRPADSEKPLFNGKALQLISIGRGYGKRITFEGDSKCSNDNYFYSDTNTAGYGFRLCAVSEGQRFTILDASESVVGTLTISNIEEETEINQEIKSGTKEMNKHVRVMVQCNVNLFANGKSSNDICYLEGVAILNRPRPGAPAVLQKVTECVIDCGSEQYTLIPGINDKNSLTQVTGSDIPASFLVKGLLPRELPVIGTYVHPNIMVGAKYKVRCLGTNKYLFEGAALKLVSIGRGYGKRITFEGESLLENDNYFYSDTDIDGYGFTIEALSVGDRLRIVDDNGEEIAQGEVFRADIPQIQHVREDCTSKADVNFTVTCHFFGLPGSFSYTTTLSGVAQLRKSSRSLSIVSISDINLGVPLVHLNKPGLSARHVQ